jgi:putative ABC transport system permease protein
MLTRCLEEMRQDSRHAVRMLIQHPAFTAAGVLSLALGIGANTAVFSVVDAALLNPLPYAEPDRLIAIHGTSPTSSRNTVSYPNFLDMRARTRTFEDTAAWFIEMFTLAGQPQAERLIGGRVSAGYFSILRVEPLLGRTFSAAEDRAGGPRVALLGERLWRRRFGADPRVVGQPVTLDGTPYTVIGVMPAHVGVGVIPRLYNDVFLPIGQYDDELFRVRHVNAAAAMGRLRPDVGLAAARAEMDTMARSLEAEYPEANKGVGFNVVSLEEDLVGHLRPTLALLLAMVTFVLLIACANVSNLILVRFTRRSREFAVRVALGASRARILRQALAESVCLAVAGGAGGVVLASWGARAALSLVPSALPDVVNVELNGRVLLVAMAAALASGLACAVAPALRATRANAGQELQQSERSGSLRRHRAQHAFLVIQVALTLILLVGAGLMARSLAHAWEVDPGFDPRGVVTFMTGLSGERASSPERVRTTVRQIAERLAALPGVQAASTVFGALPYTGNNNAVDFWRAGEPRPAGSDAPLALFSAVGPDYFRAMGISLRKGRAFASHDTSQSLRVAIVDEAFAASVYPGRDPIGQRIHLDPIIESVEVIGVVGDVKHWGLDAREAPNGARLQVYVPDAQLPDSLAPLAVRGFSVVVRSANPTADVLASLRAALREYDSGQVVINETTMENGIARSLAGRRFSLTLLGAFAFMALTLAAVGIYGLASSLATHRTYEIGVRMALGAERRHIVHALVGPVGRAAAIGIGFGLLASLGVARLVAGMLFNTSPVDPVTISGVAVLMAAITVVASYAPARRALRVDPMVALRHE